MDERTVVEQLQKIKLDSSWTTGTRIAKDTAEGSGDKGTVKAESEVVKQCAVMFVNPVRERTPHPEEMRGRGFLVHEITDWPTDQAAVRDYHAVIVRVKEIEAAPMLAARIRAKPHFGRRLLIALVPAGTAQPDRRAAEASGFDEVLNDCCDTRHLTTRILRGLRRRAELRCVLPPPERRPSAA